MNKIIAIVGMCGSGKSIASSFFEDLGWKKVYFGGITLKKMEEENIEINPENEKIMREKLREIYGMGAYAILSIPDIEEYYKNGNVIIDGLYSWDELKILKEKFGEDLKVLAIICDKDVRYERLTKRDYRPLNNEEAKRRDISEIENLAKGGPIVYADYYILNNNDMDSYIRDLERIYKEIIEKE